jgi:PAS domain S-box-containing protein
MDSFLEENPFPVLRVARDGALMYANRPAGALLAQWGCAVGDRLPASLEQQIVSVFEDGASRELDARCDGRDLSFVVVPVRERGYINLYGRDVTGRKQMEAELEERVRQRTRELTSANECLQRESDERRKVEGELRRSEEMYASIFAGIGVGISLIGPDMRLRSVNKTIHDLFPGIDLVRHPLCYESFHDPPRGEVCPCCPVLPAFRDGMRHVSIFDVPVLGEMRSFRFGASPVFAADGSVSAVIKTAEDITAERRAEALQEEEATRRRVLFEEARDGIVVLDGNGGVVEANPAFAAMIGYAPDEVSGMHVWDWDVRWSREELEERIHRLEPEGIRFETSHRRRDGTVFEVEVSTSLANWRGQRLNICTYRDITERKRAQEQLRELNAELERRVGERTAELEASNREMEGFCHAISHELRGSIARLEGFAGILAEHIAAGDRDVIAHCAGRIGVASRRLRSVIDALLAINRLSRAELNASWVDLSVLARHAARELGAGMTERAPQIRIAPEIRVWGDRSMLDICLRNLLGNAFKYTGRTPGPEIEVGAIDRDGRTVFYVRDNGVGFDMAHADKLFQPFSRLHGEQEFEGSGIGLAIVQRIVERHRGRLWAEAAPGKGATFYIALGLMPVFKENAA